MDRFDIARAFKAPFQDPEWVNKTLMGFVWTLLVVTSPAVYGAQLEYIRRVSAGNERLPEWDDFGNKWVEGFLVAVAWFIYMLPVTIVGAIFVLPGLISLIASDGGSDAAGAFFFGGMCLFGVVFTIYVLALSVFISAAMTHFAMRRTFGAFFEFGAIATKIRGGSGYFTAWLYTILISVGVSTAASVISGVTGGLGSIVMPAVTYLAAMMTGHVLGQWARVAYAAESTSTPSGFSDFPAPPPPPAAL